MSTYGPKGLVLVGPTQLYGYTAAGEAAPQAETQYIDRVRREFYAALGNMPGAFERGKLRQIWLQHDADSSACGSHRHSAPLSSGRHALRCVSRASYPAFSRSRRSFLA